jgi:NAD-dependent dihydropyrimidine dehydrogenase PreA subunit
MFDAYSINTLKLDEALCTGCGICLNVCPHAVFEKSHSHVWLAAPAACMECGACQMNCPAGAIQVESGVGCAASMIRAALSGRKEVVCG